MYSLALLIWSAIICGKFTSAFENRVYFGNDTTIKNHPYQVVLLLNGEFHCGGSLITSSIVLTAAHCVQDSGKYSIRAGSSTKTSGGEVVPLLDHSIHPRFKADTLDYDVAVLKLRYPVTLDNYHKSTIELQPGGITLPDGTEATVTGWGKTESLDSANVLQSLRVKKISQAECINLMESVLPVTMSMTCYAAIGEGSGVCHGDSGGPLVVNGKQVGIVSWGHHCGNSRLPDVYARIEHPKIHRYIRKTVKRFSHQ